MSFVLDSFAVLAHLERETGARRVRQNLKASGDGGDAVYLSAINLGEVVYIAEQERGVAVATAALGLIDQLPIILVDATRSRILSAARIKATTPISYADAFAVAAAEEFQATLLTGDPEFRAVEGRVAISWLRR